MSQSHSQWCYVTELHQASASILAIEESILHKVNVKIILKKKKKIFLKGDNECRCVSPKTNNLTLVLFLKISLKCLRYGMYCSKLFECIIQLPQFFPLSMCNDLHFTVFDLDREPTKPACIPQARCCSQNLLNPDYNPFKRCITASVSWRRWVTESQAMCATILQFIISKQSESRVRLNSLFCCAFWWVKLNN